MNNDIKEYKTPKGKKRYKFAIYAGKDEATGRSNFVRKSFNSLDDAEKSYLSIKQAIKSGQYSFKKQKHLKFEDVYNKWCANYANGVKESTLATTKRIIEGHVLPELGSLYIDRITVLSLIHI